MLKRRASLLHFLRILEACWQAGVLGELLTDQSDLHKVIYLYISLSTLPTQWKLHALSPPRYALDVTKAAKLKLCYANYSYSVLYP